MVKERWNVSKKVLLLLSVVALVNVVYVIRYGKCSVMQWFILVNDKAANETEAVTTQISDSVEYDFNKHATYRLQVLQTEIARLANISSCAGVMANPLSFWRSQRSNTTNFTAEIDLERMVKADKCAMIPLPEFIKTPPLPTPYSFEVPYLQDPPVTDILKVSNDSTSGVILFNRSSTFVVGDTVALFITIRDGRGNTKTKGGDEVRAWFTDMSSSKSTLSAKITDFNNGTYLATAVLAFVGTFRATASLAYSREHIQTIIIAQLLSKTSIVYLGAFRNKQANETVVCSHVPVIPGVNQTEICNVSEVIGTPWFCGRPIKPWLQCTDYAQTRRMSEPLTMPMNAAEKLLMKRPNKIKIIPGSSNITINVTVRADNKNLTRLISSMKCSGIPPRLTWEQQEPTGYLYQGLWHSYFCRRPERVNSTCLRNIHILLLGDSNGRALYGDLVKKSSCTELIVKEYASWHKPLKCANAHLNFTLEWRPHSNPFRTVSAKWTDLVWNKASNRIIDEVPSTGRYLIHLNHYLHGTCSHISAYVNMMTAIKESVAKLVKRNPGVTVILQGPHVIWNFGSHQSHDIGDPLRRFIVSIQSGVFHDLRDRVYYLQTSDLTTAVLNANIHPPDNWQISNMMTGFVCGGH